jgi:hypothetical protein
LPGPVDTSLRSGSDHGTRRRGMRRITEPKYAIAGLVTSCFAPDYQKVI